MLYLNFSEEKYLNNKFQFCALLYIAFDDNSYFSSFYLENLREIKTTCKITLVLPVKPVLEINLLKKGQKSHEEAFLGEEFYTFSFTDF